MPSLGNLTVQIGAETRGLDRGVEHSTSRLTKLDRQMGRIVRQAGKIGAAAIGAGAALTAGLVKSGLASIDAQSKLARQLGTTQAEVAGITRAFSDAGIAEGQLRSNLQAMNKRLGEAQEGSGRAAETLERLGLSAEELARMPLSERLDTIGASINSLDTQTAKASATADIFSRSGLDMMNVFAQGEGAISAATREAEQFGTAVSQIDAARVEAANDAMSRIGDVTQGVSNQLASEFAPVLEGIAGLFTDNAKEAGGFRDEARAMVDTTVRGVGFLADVLEGIRRTFKLMGQGVAVFGLSFKAAMLEAAQAVLDGPVDKINTLIRQLNKIPGVDIGLVTSIDTEVEQARAAVLAGREAMANTLNAPMPSEGIMKAYQAQREASRKAAEAAIANKKTERDQTNAVAGQMAEAEADRRAAELERIREHLMTRREIEERDHQQRLERLTQAREAELLTEQKYQHLKQELAKQHEDTMAQLEQQANNERVALKKQEEDAKYRATQSAFSDLSTLMNTGSRKLFEIGKAAAIAEAVVSGHKAAVSAWEKGMTVGGPPVAAAFLAASLAKTGAQISAINSQSVGGGGGAQATGSATTAVNAATTGVQSQGGGGSSRQISIEGINPDALFSGRQIRTLIERINEEQEDGTALITVGG